MSNAFSQMKCRVFVAGEKFRRKTLPIHVLSQTEENIDRISNQDLYRIVVHHVQIFQIKDAQLVLYLMIHILLLDRIPNVTL